VAGKSEPKVILFVENDNSKVRAEVVKYNDYVDAAIIKVQGTLKDKKPITKIGTVNISDPIYIVGNPLHNKMIYTEGIVAGFAGISMLLQAPCIYGSSGSGVFNAKGELVGLVYALQAYPGWMGIPEVQITHSLVVDTTSIKVFLKDLWLYNE
jgi:S1-C subfamily serine protease